MERDGEEGERTCHARHVPVRHLPRGHAISISPFRGLPFASPRWGHRIMTAFLWASVLPREVIRRVRMSFCLEAASGSGPASRTWPWDVGKAPCVHPHWSGRELSWNAWTLGRRKDFTLRVLNAVRSTSEPSLAYFGTRIKEFVMHRCPEMSLLLFIMKRKSKAKPRGSGQR